MKERSDVRRCSLQQIRSGPPFRTSSQIELAAIAQPDKLARCAARDALGCEPTTERKPFTRLSSKTLYRDVVSTTRSDRSPKEKSCSSALCIPSECRCDQVRCVIKVQKPPGITGRYESGDEKWRLADRTNSAATTRGSKQVSSLARREQQQQQHSTSAPGTGAMPHGAVCLRDPLL